MTVICEFCKTEYDEFQQTCPNCGAKNPHFDAKKREKYIHRQDSLTLLPVILIFAFVGTAIIVSFLLINRITNKANNILPLNTVGEYKEASGYYDLSDAQKAKIMNAELSDRDLATKEALDAAEIMDSENISKFLGYYFPAYTECEVVPSSASENVFFIFLDDEIELRYQTYQSEPDQTFSSISYSLYEEKPEYRYVCHATFYDNGEIYR